jgi:hypothetical protein
LLSMPQQEATRQTAKDDAKTCDFLGGIGIWRSVNKQENTSSRFLSFTSTYEGRVLAKHCCKIVCTECTFVIAMWLVSSSISSVHRHKFFSAQIVGKKKTTFLLYSSVYP